MTSVERVRPRPGARGAAEPVEPRAVDLRSQLGAVLRFWRTVLAFTLLGLLAAVLFSVLAKPTYQATSTFFVATSDLANSTALQADEYAQRRINSYVGVIESERFAQVVLADTGAPLTTTDLLDEITVSTDPDTVLFTVRVTDESPDQALAIAQSIGENIDRTIGELDNRGNRSFVQIRTISGPTLLPEPVTPRVKLNLAIGLLLGLGLGIAQALLRHQLDRTFRSRDAVASATGVPVLGWLHEDRGARRKPILDPESDRSPRSEDIRQLRTNLRFVNIGHPLQVLAVTSSVDQENKSTTAANLAISFAQAGRRTLLVEADLRTPSLGRYLGVSSEHGLTDVLIGEADLARAAQRWSNPNLTVLTSGKLPPNPSELLGGPAMERLIDQARREYDLVILDTPPVLPVTDAAVTSAQADGVLLLVRFGKTQAQQVRRALESLTSVDAPVVGTVVTMARDNQADRATPYPTTWA